MGKRRLRPWLEDHINKNTFHGLKWVDHEKRMFSIPWKSKKSRNWRATDAQIFKAWASKSGTLKEGNPEKPADWKAQFRMAFNSVSYIKEVKELHDLSDPENPCKVYKFVDKGTKSNSKSDSVASSSSSQMSPALPGNFLEAFGTDGSNAGNGPQYSLFGMTFDSNIPTVVYNQGESPSSLNNVVADANVVLEHPNAILPSDSYEQFQETFINFSNMATNTNIQQATTGNDESWQQNSEMPWVRENFDTNSYPPMPLNSQSQQHFHNDSSSSACEPECTFIKQPLFEIKVYLLQQCVIKKLIDENGVRLFHGDLLNHTETETRTGAQTVFGPMDINQISIPDIDETRGALLINEKDKKRIKDVLYNLHRGLILRVLDNGTHADISAERLCRARVCVRNQVGNNTCLSRKSNTPECIFDLNLFCEHLNAFIENDGPIPSPTVNITFGQECRSDFMGKNRAHVHAKVTHLGAEELLREALNSKQGDSEVLLSSLTLDDALADLFKKRISL